MLRPLLRVDSLSKRYGGRVSALTDVTFAAGPGVVGILGPNGAGKTTLLRCIATLLRPTSGCIELNGLDSVCDCRDYRIEMGYLPQQFGLHQGLTACEQVIYFAILKGMRSSEAKAEAERLLAEVGLADVAARRTSDLSGGMRQRVGIAIALIGGPRLLVVDEPSAGLDPDERMRLRALLSRLARDTIVLLSTHIVQDVELGCSRVLVVDRGHVLADGSPADLVTGLQGSVWSVELPAEQLDEVARRARVVSSATLDDGRVSARLVGACPMSTATSVEPCLDDVYAQLVGSERL